jgi:hypothetical protein
MGGGTVAQADRVDLEGIEGLADLPESLIDIKNFSFTLFIWEKKLLEYWGDPREVVRRRGRRALDETFSDAPARTHIQGGLPGDLLDCRGESGAQRYRR